MTAQVLITMDDLEVAVPLNAALEAARLHHRDGLRDGRRSAPRSGRSNPTSLILTGAVHEPPALELLALARDQEVFTLALLEPTDDASRAIAIARLGPHARVMKPVKPDEVVADHPPADRPPPAAAAHRHQRPERGGAGGAGQDRADGAGLEHGADPGRVGHRQGAGREGDARLSARGAASRSSRSTARRCRRRCSSPSCSATRRAPSPARPSGGWGGSSWPTRGRSSSTRSARCRRRPRSSCSGCWRTAPSSGWAGPSRSRWMSGSSRRPTRTSASRSPLGEFRDDLYYRLNVLNIYLPPLRERREDIPLLARRVHPGVRRYQHDRPFRGITAEAMQRLVEAPWPGNVRQLRNLIEIAWWCWPRAPRSGPADIPPDVFDGAPVGPAGPGAGGCSGSWGRPAPAARPSSCGGSWTCGSRSRSCGAGWTTGGARCRSSRWRRAPSPASPSSRAGVRADVLYRPGMTMADVEKATIDAALGSTRATDGRRLQTLGIGERTLYRKIKEYHLE